MNFQRLVNKIRKRGWSVERISRKAGVSKAYIYKISNGKAGEPTWTIGQKLIALESKTRP